MQRGSCVDEALQNSSEPALCPKYSKNASGPHGGWHSCFKGLRISLAAIPQQWRVLSDFSEM